uniref:Apple domain-containing protein n=1 Tax=Plectus sambesii TaxID=2011161 RepID=A0A914XEG2_9BILA
MSSAAAFLLSFLPLLHIANGKCYLPEAGLTLIGHDYRRFSDVDQVSVCARGCLSDCACFGFVWFKNGTCTLKSRSLDSGVTADEDARFGLCIDEEDPDRDRLWDHEFTGEDVKIHMKVHRDECGAIFAEDPDRDRLWDHEFTGEDVKIHMKVHRDECAAMCLKDESSSTLYSWTPNRLASSIGMCRCKGRMTGVRMRFGATSGFLDRK